MNHYISDRRERGLGKILTENISHKWCKERLTKETIVVCKNIKYSSMMQKCLYGYRIYLTKFDNN